MRIGLIGDVHLHNFRQFDLPFQGPPAGLPAGVNHRCALTSLVLERALSILKDDGKVQDVFQLGDLVEVPGAPAAVLAQAVLAARRARQPFACIVGNHDAHTTPATAADSALAAFEAGSTVRPFAAVAAGMSGLEAWNYGVGRLNMQVDRSIVSSVLMHAGLWTDKEPPPHMQGKEDLSVEGLWERVHRPIENDKPIILAAGHWHHARYFGRQKTAYILQAGVLHPTSFNDDGWERVGFVYVFDDAMDTIEAFQVPGLRFLNVHDLWQGVLDVRMVLAEGSIPLIAVHAETARAAEKIRDGLLEVFTHTIEGAVQPICREGMVLRVHPPDGPAPAKPAQQSREAYAVRAASRMPLVAEHERGRAVQRILAHWKTL